jgi:hypothetical protein
MLRRPTKAQQVKKALKGHFENLRCVNGKGTAYGWVDLRFDYPKQKTCTCDLIQFGICYECSKTKQEAKEKVYQLLNESRVELYSYYTDDGYNTQRDCMLIDINLI